MTGFRQYLFPHDHPRLADVRGMDPYAYREHARTPGTFTGGLVEGWTPLQRRPFRGITEDGELRTGLYDLTPAEPGEQAPVAGMVDAARALLDLLGEDDRAKVQHAVDAVEWQTWANPEFMQFDTGLRLELQPPEVRAAALALAAASLSPEGFAQVQLMMRINGFLGDVVDLPTVLGEFSYNIASTATPTCARPGAGSCSATTARSTAWSSRAGWSSRRSSWGPSPTPSTRARTPPRGPSPAASRSGVRCWPR